MMFCHLRTEPQEASIYAALLACEAYIVAIFHMWDSAYQQLLMPQHCCNTGRFAMCVRYGKTNSSCVIPLEDSI